jgi:hypothetical protein
MLDVMLARLGRVVAGVMGVAAGRMGVVGGLFVVAALMMFGRFAVMTRCVFVMFGRLGMVLARGMG